jgi:hypothetical protein
VALLCLPCSSQRNPRPGDSSRSFHYDWAEQETRTLRCSALSSLLDLSQADPKTKWLEEAFERGLGFGDSTCVYQQGAIVVDDEKAGCLCVVEND